MRGSWLELRSGFAVLKTREGDGCSFSRERGRRVPRQWGHCFMALRGFGYSIRCKVRFRKLGEVLLK